MVEDARDKFRIGDRVITTLKAEKAGISQNCRTGIVVGFAAFDEGVRVKRDYYKTAMTYHASFWERPR